MASAVLRFARDCQRYLLFPRPASRGVYAIFAQARRHIGEREVGFDHADVAAYYAKRLSAQRESADYPALFHVSRSTAPRPVVLDFGGNVGIHFLRSRTLLAPLAPRWIVWDVPEIARMGRILCADYPEVSFIDDLAQLDVTHVDFLLAIGSMQCVEGADEPLPRLLARGVRPRVVVLDQLPIHDGPAYVTVQNGGLSWYPQRILNRRELAGAMASAGYLLRDAWEFHLDACRPPFHRARWVHPYSGLCFVDATAEA